MSVRSARPVVLGLFLVASAALAAACTVEDANTDTPGQGGESSFVQGGFGGDTVVYGGYGGSSTGLATYIVPGTNGTLCTNDVLSTTDGTTSCGAEEATAGEHCATDGATLLQGCIAAPNCAAGETCDISGGALDANQLHVGNCRAPNTFACSGVTGTGGAGGTDSGLAGAGGTPATTTPTAWIRLADFAQTTDAIDICFRASTDTTDWSAIYPRVGDSATGYGQPGAFDYDVITTLSQSDPGAFDIRVVNKDATNCGDANLIYAGFTDQQVTFLDGSSYTLAVFGTSAEAALTIKAIPDVVAPTDGSVSLQGVNGLTQTDGSVTFGLVTPDSNFTAFASNVGFTFTGAEDVAIPAAAGVHIDVISSTATDTAIAQYPAASTSYSLPGEFPANGRRNVYVSGTKVGETNAFDAPIITVCNVPSDLDSEATTGVDNKGAAGGIGSPNCLYGAN